MKLLVRTRELEVQLCNVLKVYMEIKRKIYYLPKKIESNFSMIKMAVILEYLIRLPQKSHVRQLTICRNNNKSDLS